MDRKEPIIRYDKYNQGYISFGSTIEDPTKTQTEPSPEQLDQPETKLAHEASPETVASLTETTAKAMDLIGEPEDDSPEAPEARPEKVLSEQEREIWGMVEAADACANVRARLDWHDRLMEEGNYNEAQSIYHSRYDRSRALFKIKKLNLEIRKAIASGLWAYRKGHPELSRLKKEDRDPKTKSGLTFEIYKNVRYDSEFQAKLKEVIANQEVDFTFADLLAMHERKQAQKRGRHVGGLAPVADDWTGGSVTPHIEALAEQESRRDDAYEPFISNLEEQEQALQRDEDAHRDAQGEPDEPNEVVELPTKPERVYQLTPTQSAKIDAMVDSAGVPYRTAFERVTGANYDDFDSIEG
jgi:hypothetical protein